MENMENKKKIYWIVIAVGLPISAVLAFANTYFHYTEVKVADFLTNFANLVFWIALMYCIYRLRIDRLNEQREIAQKNGQEFREKSLFWIIASSIILATIAAGIVDSIGAKIARDMFHAGKWDDQMFRLILPRLPERPRRLNEITP